MEKHETSKRESHVKDVKGTYVKMWREHMWRCEVLQENSRPEIQEKRYKVQVRGMRWHKSPKKEMIGKTSENVGEHWIT